MQNCLSLQKVFLGVERLKQAKPQPVDQTETQEILLHEKTKCQYICGGVRKIQMIYQFVFTCFVFQIISTPRAIVLILRIAVICATT